MNKYTLALLFGMALYVNACERCGGHKPDEDEEDPDVGAPNPSTYNVWADFAVRWQEINDRLELLSANVTDISEALEEAVEDGGLLGDNFDDLQAQIDEYNEQLDAYEARIDDLEANHTAEVLAEIRDNGVYVSDRWRIFEASNNDLLVRDTESSGQPSYRFVAGSRETFGDE